MKPSDSMAVWLQIEIQRDRRTEKAPIFLKKYILAKLYLFSSEIYWKMLSKLNIGT